MTTSKNASAAAVSTTAEKEVRESTRVARSGWQSGPMNARAPTQSPYKTLLSQAAAKPRGEFGSVTRCPIDTQEHHAASH